MLVVDTTVWVDYFNGQINPETEYLNHALTEEIILVGDLILAETLQGFRSDKDFQQAQAALSNFEQSEMVNESQQWTVDRKKDRSESQSSILFT